MQTRIVLFVFFALIPRRPSKAGCVSVVSANIPVIRAFSRGVHRIGDPQERFASRLYGISRRYRQFGHKVAFHSFAELIHCGYYYRYG